MSSQEEDTVDTRAVIKVGSRKSEVDTLIVDNSCCVINFNEF